MDDKQLAAYKMAGGGNPADGYLVFVGGFLTLYLLWSCWVLITIWKGTAEMDRDKRWDKVQWQVLRVVTLFLILVWFLNNG
ncbi:TIGR03758 family integrating conjugative element protein [Pokkaliibacter sp. MBI-7]|uniref:TIGR03758 family integrating conjugative element protein n=1 Tax=Pokkaliibacter sp. MBI-7 TaxID=3040600 RepID=UPI00244817D3|nr:TIGR03758 family integrating conjugative element protein [Pokkaliibacter sp. MBI-7]MDH2434747.1 TIGR03758 family integrating conjugative element protein [Pokkaliibacter sp. MBI-7]MDH2434784.1 TIGR03758 family integrating conjugative element protein [Pokkaliibacter sp. MBI-7]MDH2436661.1 TIGR03758 family integrating conjugative element protein [Pokkaliibacter sp. MBI-7]